MVAGRRCSTSGRTSSATPPSAPRAPQGTAAGDVVVPRDTDPHGEVLAVASAATVSRISCRGGCGPNAPGTLAGLSATFGREATSDLLSEYRGASSQYWVTLRDGTVVAIDEQYLP